jgi:Mrp family chromosome partitioning ATPase
MPWVGNVDVSLIKHKPVGAGKPNTTLSKVANIIAVSSCKGGVGKSTVAVNFACELRRRGLRVGLLDADIYGPSLPLMLGAVDMSVHLCPDNQKWSLPLESETGLKMISFGHVNPKSGAPGAGGVGAAVGGNYIISIYQNESILLYVFL